MTVPITYRAGRIIVVVLALSLLAAGAAGLSGLGPLSDLASAIPLVVGLLRTLSEGGVWQ